MNLFRTEDSQLDDAIAQCYSMLSNLNPVEDQYQTVTTRLTELNALKNQGLDPNKVLLAAANVFVGLKVLRFEENNIVSTKLWNFMQKF